MADVEAALSSSRLRRYNMTDTNKALRLYVWNIRLCESAYLVCQFAEVSYRNAVHQAVKTKYQDWHRSKSFEKMLPDKLKSEIKRVSDINLEKADAEDRIVAGLSMGFWLHMTSKKFRNNVFSGGFLPFFPHFPQTSTLDDLYKAVDGLRTFRNRIAHHKPIFDKRAKFHHESALKLIGWINPNAMWLVRELSNFDRVLGKRPAI